MTAAEAYQWNGEHWREIRAFLNWDAEDVARYTAAQSAAQ